MFKLSAAVIAFRLNYREMPVANGVTISEGDVVKLTNGVFSLCATNEEAWGVCKTHGTHVGNAAGTVVIQAVMAFGVLWEAEQGALADAVTQPGDLVDINATSDGITTAANNDFRIWEVDRLRGVVVGTFQDTFV